MTELTENGFVCVLPIGDALDDEGDCSHKHWLEADVAK